MTLYGLAYMLFDILRAELISKLDNYIYVHYTELSAHNISRSKLHFWEFEMDANLTRLIPVELV